MNKSLKETFELKLQSAGFSDMERLKIVASLESALAVEHFHKTHKYIKPGRKAKQ